MTFKVQIKDTVVLFSLIRLIIPLNTGIHSIAAHQIINLELEIGTSSLNWGVLNVSARGWEGAGFFPTTWDSLTHRIYGGHALTCLVSSALQDWICLTVGVAELPTKLLLNCHTLQPSLFR